MSLATKGSLPEPRKRLVEWMQEINFGRIEGLLIVDCEPATNPLPRMIREIKFGGENGPRQELTAADFILKPRVIELLAFFDEFQNGVVDRLEIKHGLPFRVVVTEVTA